MAGGKQEHVPCKIPFAPRKLLFVPVDFLEDQKTVKILRCIWPPLSFWDITRFKAVLSICLMYSFHEHKHAERASVKMAAGEQRYVGDVRVVSPYYDLTAGCS